MRKLAAGLAAAVVGASPHVHAKPPKPAHMKEAEAAKKACQPYADHIRDVEAKKKLPRHTMTGLLYKESRCNPKAENKRTRARGIGQFVPSGAAAVGRIQRERGETPWFRYSDAWEPAKSIRAAAELIAYSLEACGSLSEAIGAYNSGRCTSNAFSRAVLRLAAAIRYLAHEEPTS